MWTDAFFPNISQVASQLLATLDRLWHGATSLREGGERKAGEDSKDGDPHRQALGKRQIIVPERNQDDVDLPGARVPESRKS